MGMWREPPPAPPKVDLQPWLVWLSGLSARVETKGLEFDSQSGHIPVRFDSGQDRSSGCTRGHDTLMFLSPSLPLPVKTNKYDLKTKKKDIKKKRKGPYSSKECGSMYVVGSGGSTLLEHACGKPVGYFQQVWLLIKPTESTTPGRASSLSAEDREASG